MRVILVLLVVTSFFGMTYAQTQDEQDVLKRFISKAASSGLRGTKCSKNKSLYATIVIEFSKDGSPYDVIVLGTSECLSNYHDEIRQKLLSNLSTQDMLDKENFLDAYIIAPILLSQAQTVLPENMTASESWVTAFKDFDFERFQNKHLKYIIPIEFLIYTTTH